MPSLSHIWGQVPTDAFVVYAAILSDSDILPEGVSNSLSSYRSCVFLSPHASSTEMQVPVDLYHSWPIIVMNRVETVRAEKALRRPWSGGNAILCNTWCVKTSQPRSHQGTAIEVLFISSVNNRVAPIYLIYRVMIKKSGQ